MGSIGREVAKKGNLLVLAMPHRGHLMPMLRFVTEVARRGVTITFVMYEDILAGFSSQGILSELQGLDFRFVGLQNPWGPTNNIPVEDSKNLEESFKPVLEKLLHDKSTGVAGPTTILTDMFITWAQGVSEKLELPFYMFIPSGALLAKFKQEYNWLFAQKQFQMDADGRLSKYSGAVDFLGLSPLCYHELVSTSRLYPAAFLFRSKLMCQAAGIVLNTWYDLEEKVIQSISLGRPGFEENKVGKIYAAGPLLSTPAKVGSVAVTKEWKAILDAVGPLLLTPAMVESVAAAKGLKAFPDPAGPFFSTPAKFGGFAVTEGLKAFPDECLLWLDRQPPFSVLYVAFGTMAQLTAGEIHELALGLEASYTHFLWVLPQRKDTPSVKNLLPQGFEARVGDRGHIITGWAPQVQILANLSTGAFLTHAGWNSCMESITQGVPMIAWPQWAEQHLNCRYLVDHLKIADQIRTGPENILDRKEVERAVRVLMLEEEGYEMKKRVQELQRKAVEAATEGGSMSKAIDKFAHDICAPDDLKKV